MEKNLTENSTVLTLQDVDFMKIAKLVHDIAGIVLPENKRPLVQSRLQKRLRALNLRNFGVYSEYIAKKENEEERRELISAVTTNVTSFFREMHHFELLEKTILPGLIARARQGGRVRIWSAGCSSGEEPYSIAATVHGAFPEAARHDFRILATDIDRTVIEKVQAATYPADALTGLAPDRARLLFAGWDAGGPRQIAQPVRALVACKLLNLKEKWPMKGPFDVIFCRNVVIYFDKPTQEELWFRFRDLLAPAGHLIIGHSERLSGGALADFTTAGITAYRRN